MAHYDLLVIGTGPAGQKSAVQAAKLGKKVGVTRQESRRDRAPRSRRRRVHQYRHHPK
ncbi:MAG: sthA [Nitrospira sp.]|nr:sthA [Nitrospira sp.]